MFVRHPHLNFIKITVFSTLLPALLGCTLWRSNSRVFHTEHEPIRTTFPNGSPELLDWVPSNDPQADYDRFIKPRLAQNGKPAVFAPKNHITTRRAQFWIDVIDAHLRKLYPTAMQGIPQPVANVWANASPNGMAMPLSSCIDVKVALSSSNNISYTNTTLGINFSGMVFEVKEPRCVTRQASPQDVTTWFTRNNGTCRLLARSNDIVVDTNCEKSRPLVAAGITGAQRFQTIGTSPIITLTSAMFSEVPQEEHLVAVIAHELAHYYRSHPAAKTSNLNFFYKLENTNSNDAPKRTQDPILIDLGNRAISASRLGMDSAEARAVLVEAQNQRLGYYTFEQEADELALEWLAEIGIQPSRLIEKMFTLLEFKEKKNGASASGDLEFGFQKCFQLYKNKWQENGNTVFVPIGNFSNPHHSLCYRIFNASKELDAHKYTVNSNVPKVENESWDLVVSGARELSAMADSANSPETIIQAVNAIE